MFNAQECTSRNAATLQDQLYSFNFSFICFKKYSIRQFFCSLTQKCSFFSKLLRFRIFMFEHFDLNFETYPFCLRQVLLICQYLSSMINFFNNLYNFSNLYKKDILNIHTFFLYSYFKFHSLTKKYSMHVPKIPVQSLIYLAFLILITLVPIALCVLSLWLCFYCRKKKRIANSWSK